MNENASVRQGIARLIELESGSTDLHTGTLGAVEKLSGLVEASLQLLDALAHPFSRPIAGISRAVALDTHGWRRRAQHLIGGRMNLVIAVTLNAFGQPQCIEGGLVRTFLEETRLPRVTLTANVRH